jgi:hypothetical protein
MGGLQVEIASQLLSQLVAAAIEQVDSNGNSGE